MIGKKVKTVTFGAVLALAMLLSGCGGSNLSGTYTNGNGVISVKFDSHKAYLQTIGGTVQLDYKTDGNKVLLESPNGNLVLTRNEDGSLDTPWGTLKKKGT